MTMIRRYLTMTAFAAGALLCVNAQEKSDAAKPSPAPTVKAKAVAAPVAKQQKQAPVAAEKQTTAVKQEKSVAAGGDTLVVKARLIEIPGKMPPNDLYNYVYIMKYKIISVVKGSYTGEEILVGEYNPLIPRKQIKDKMEKNVGGDVVKFTMGDKHELRLITPIEKVWNDAVEDEYIDSDLPKYYAVQTNMIK